MNIKKTTKKKISKDIKKITENIKKINLNIDLYSEVIREVFNFPKDSVLLR